MLRSLLLLLLCGGVSCWVTCPDGKIRCNEQQTCCFTTEGYRCCHYPNALPSVDQASPSADEALSSVNQAPPSADEAPLSVDQVSPTVVYCDNYYTCPDGYTCCRHTRGGWTCCQYSPAHCCLDEYHCCPYGYDCDYTYTHCIRQGVPHPFSSPLASVRAADRLHVPQTSSSSSLSAQPSAPTLTAQGEEHSIQEGGVIHCDSTFYCPKGYTCCQKQSQQWSCCPYPLGMCCADGVHCCQYGYTCDPTGKVCRR